jgi:hypothetical protein
MEDLSFALCHIVMGSDTILGHVHAAAMIVSPVKASVVGLSKPVVGLIHWMDA